MECELSLFSLLMLTNIIRCLWTATDAAANDDAAARSTASYENGSSSAQSTSATAEPRPIRNHVQHPASRRARQPAV